MLVWHWVERGIGSISAGIWASAAGGGRWHVGVAIGVTAMAGLALAATLVVSSRRGSLKSPWSRRKRKNALTRRQWNALFLPDGKLRDGGIKFLKKARSGGIDPSIRAEVWPFLLGVYELNSTEAERSIIKQKKRAEYEKLRRRCLRLLNQSDKVPVLEGAGEVGKTKSPVHLEDPESHLSEDPESHLPENGGSNEDHTENGGSNEDQTVFDSTPEKSPANMEESSDNDNHPVYDKTPDSNACNEKDGHSNGDKPVHDKSADSNLRNIEEESSGITDVNASAVETDSSDSESSVEDDDEAIPSISEGNSETDPKYAKLASLKGGFSSRTAEDFSTWQRIIRLDAIRANTEWVMYSPNQATITEEKANQNAVVVGLKDYDHLEPCMIYHASRLVAVLEAYALYDPEIGYCQGMSDLLTPILAVIEDDNDAFWCFAGFMRKARHNFRLDEVGIRRQLSIVAKIIKSKDLHLYRHLEKLQAEDCFFVYRMVVVLFRRELSFEQTVSLWEVMWADQAAIRAGIGKSSWGRIRLRAPPTDDLLLYAIAACVLQRRKQIIEKYSSMDEIIRECNSMAGHLDVWKLLDDAHDLVVTLHDKI